jgi:hypothetical protein
MDGLINNRGSETLRGLSGLPHSRIVHDETDPSAAHYSRQTVRLYPRILGIGLGADDPSQRPAVQIWITTIGRLGSAVNRISRRNVRGCRREWHIVAPFVTNTRCTEPRNPTDRHRRGYHAVATSQRRELQSVEARKRNGRSVMPFQSFDEKSERRPSVVSVAPSTSAVTDPEQPSE